MAVLLALALAAVPASPPAAHGPPPAAVASAVAEIERAAAAGDRRAFLAALAPDARAAGVALADQLVAPPGRPWAAVRCEVLDAEPAGDGWRGHLACVTAGASAGEEAAPAWAEGEPGLAPDPGAALHAMAFRSERAAPGERALLRLLPDDFGAPVVDATLDLRLDPGARRLDGRVRLELAPDVAGSRALALTLPPLSRVRLAGPGGARLEPAGDGVVVRLPAPAAAGRVVLELEQRLVLERARDEKPGRPADAIYLSHGGHLAPWSRGAFTRVRVTTDVPDGLEAVALGTRETLDAEPGRRRVVHDTVRPVQVAALAVGRYRVEERGPLSLWRLREVGGEAGVVLSDLERLVGWHERLVGPLPHRAYRLVELPGMQGLATSYASVIFMTPDVLAARRQRLEILSHEVAHQWWGNWVGGRRGTRWLSEGMAEALAALSARELLGEDEWLAGVRERRANALRLVGARARPLADASGSQLDYDRGALALLALRDATGAEGFQAVLRAWNDACGGRDCGVAELEAVAARAAGRPLDHVLGPWLHATALPVVDLAWEPTPAGARLVLAQEEPWFELPVPVRLRGGPGEVADVAVRLDGPRTIADVPASWTVAQVELDPERVAPLVREDERTAYRLAEADACLARGDAARAVALLEGEASGSLLPLASALALFAGRHLLGDADEAASALDVVVRELPDAAARAHALRDAADALVAAGAAAAALPILEQLDREVRAGASVPLRLGLALRQLGREDEARAAFARALERRPSDASARAALGMAAPDPAASPDVPLAPGALEIAFDDPDDLRASQLLALDGGRAALLNGDARRLRLVTDGAASPPAALPAGNWRDAAGAGGSRIALLESGPRRSRVVVVDAASPSRVAAAHDRLPAGATGLRWDGERLALLVPERDGVGAWRFAADLLAASEGPDDEDGLRTLRAGADPRLERIGAAPADAAPVALTRTWGLAWSGEPGALAAAGTDLYRELSGTPSRIVAAGEVPARVAGEALRLVVSAERDPSPFADDAWTVHRLVTVDAGGTTSRPLPDGVMAAALAPDGTLALAIGPSPGRPARLVVEPPP